MFLGLQNFAWAGKLNADSVLELLRQGNQRFANGHPKYPNTSPTRLNLAARTNQADYALATILSCADSRVPVEYIFDRGIMDLFVIRVAGNTYGEEIIGSLEYGSCHLKTPVLIIMGHTQCGAVTAATKGENPATEPSLRLLLSKISPAVQKTANLYPQATPNEFLAHAIEENIWLVIEKIFQDSSLIRQMAQDGKLRVVGAIYELETGNVRWLPQNKVTAILKKTEAIPTAITE